MGRDGGLGLAAAPDAGGREIHVGRYDVLTTIASGGMGTVYLAELAGTGRRYAIKRLHPYLAREPAFVEMFVDEAKVASRIRHPNVVPILEVGTDPDSLFVVMDYVEGATPAELVSAARALRSRIPPAVAIQIVLDALAGLHAAHELRDENGHVIGLVHRDVSPHNILVGIDGVARLTDFGIAHRPNGARPSELKGKLPYMSPEQASLEMLDRRSDVFSMGIVLVELLSGRRLFKHGTHLDTVRHLLLQPIPKLRERAPDAPIELEELCSRALARDRNERFSSAFDFARALDDVARRLGLVATRADVAASINQLVGRVLHERAARAAEVTVLAERIATDRPTPTPHDGQLAGRFDAATRSISLPPSPAKAHSATFPLVLAAVLAGSAATLAFFDRGESSPPPTPAVAQPR